MNDIQINPLYDPNELYVRLDSSPQLSDDGIKAMSAYFQSESFQYAATPYAV